MESPLNYEKTFKIEILNEFANGVYADLINYMFKNNFDVDDTSSAYGILLEQFSKMLNANLFDMSLEEVAIIELYWTNMNKIVEEITKQLPEK